MTTSAIETFPGSFTLFCVNFGYLILIGLTFIGMHVVPSNTIGQEFQTPIKEVMWKSTVKVVSTYTNGNQGIGTAFLVSKAITKGDQTNRVIFLVTNKHILGDWNIQDGQFSPACSSLTIHYYTKDFHPTRILLINTNGQRLNPHLIRLHRAPKADVAAIALLGSFSGPQVAEAVILDVSYLSRFSNVEFFGLGSQVYVLGYPHGITSIRNNYPLAKSAYLASLPGEEFELQLNASNKLTGKLYMLDGTFVPGVSGGPVMTPASLQLMLDDNGQLAWLSKPTDNRVIGIFSQITAAGLSIAFSSDYILEVIEDFESTVSKIEGNVLHFK